MDRTKLPSRGALWARKGAIRPLLIAAFASVSLFAAAASFEIPPVTASVTVAGQTIPVSAQGAFDFNLRAGMAGLQDHITPILQSLLNRSDGCGERLSIQDAILTPAPPAAQLTIQFHFEKFDCVKLLGKEALGKQSSKRLFGGNGTALLLITPVVEQTNAVRLSAEVGPINADGSLGELLNSGSLGNALRDKIRESLLKALEKSSGFETALPAEAPPCLTIVSAAFAGPPDGWLLPETRGRLAIPPAKVASLIGQLRGKR